MKNKFITSIILFLFICHYIGAENIQKLWQPYYITPRTGEQHIDISHDWELGYSDNPIGSTTELQTISQWICVKEPTSVQWALYKAGKLPHPYEHQNSLSYKWIEDKLWYYKKEFEVPANENYVFLYFEGLDYFSRIWLNGELLGQHAGMFGGPALEISSKINKGKKNTLIVEVESGNKQPEIRKIYTNPDGFFASDYNKRGEGAPIVKGWAFTGGTGAENYYTLGMWRGARIEIVPKTHIERPYLYTKTLQGKKAILSFSTEVFVNTHTLNYKMHPWGNALLSRGVSSDKLIPVQKKLSLKIDFFSGNQPAFSKIIPLNLFEGRTWINEELEITNPQLWWPNGMGKPHLYNVRLTLLDNDKPIDKHQLDFGIRTIERIRTTGPQVEEMWENWHFVINGKPIFVKGTNWMPADWLLDLSANRYHWLLEMAQKAGMQMIRVWGSGLQETESFYEYCNKFGIMVWQDFQISHINTPAWPQDVVEAHVMQNIYRLRNHPSLALWNGGNGMNPFATDNSTITGITERYVSMFDPARFYSRSSSAAGNAHLYPDMDPSWYAGLYKYIPFISETGIHSIPDAKNLKKVIDEKEFNDLGNMFSEEFINQHPDIIHHFAEYNPARVPRMISRASHVDDMKNPSIESLSEASQVGAGEFYQVLTDGVLSNYPNTTGLLYWVFNRMWPVFSGIMLVDGHNQPVAPYYFTKRTFEQVHVAVRLKRLLWRPGENLDLSPFIINHTSNVYKNNKVKLTVMDDTFKPVWEDTQTVSLKSGVNVHKLKTNIFTIPETYQNRFLFVIAELFNPQEKLISRSVYWPRSVKLMNDSAYYNKYIKEPQPWPTFDKGPWLKPIVSKTRTSLSFKNIEIKEKNENRLVIQAIVKNKGKSPSFMTRLHIQEDYNFYTSDNFFWLMPGEEKNVEIVVRTENRRKSQPINIELFAWNTKKIVHKIKY